jgi:hypothetical protein
LQAKNAKNVPHKSIRGHNARTRKASISDKHKLTPEEARIVRQSEKDIKEGKYSDFSSAQELLEAINNDKL